jgi:hypothetical protein
VAWKYPKHSLQEEYVIEIDPINENFLSVVEETSGYLNEHNIRAFPVVDLDYDDTTPTIKRDKLATGASMRLHVSQHNGAHSLARATHLEEYAVLNPGSTIPWNVVIKPPSNWVALARMDTFQTFDKVGLSKTFTAVGGNVWICASINIHTHDTDRLAYALAFPAGGADPDGELAAAGYTVPDVFDSLATQKGFGFNVAIEVDGSIIYESLVGTGDLSNEYLQTDPDDADITSPQGGGGINGAMIPVVTDAIVTLTPGEHTVRVAIMDILATNRSGTVRPTNIAGRSIFALELLR